MAKNSCSLQISCEDGILIASLFGELDHHGAVAVRSLIDSQIIKQKPKKAVLELSALDFMDSSGLGLIMGRYALAQRLGVAFSVSSPNERVQRILKLAGLERMVKIELADDKGGEGDDGENGGKERKNEGKGN